jgi:NADPH:quinone reductase-like Zn-dependent oxidoreductase
MTITTATTEATKTMKAIVRRRWGRPRDVVELADVAKPEPADDEVLVRVRATSINRSDYYALGGVAILMRPMIGGFLRPKSEGIGGDFAGIAEAVGKNVADVRPGEEVFGVRTGAFAEYVAVKTAVGRKPANLSFEEAAAVPIAALTALQALRDHGGLQPGQRVLVNGGSGGVGTFAVQLAKALGAGHVTAVCSPRNVDRARSLGADRVIDYTRDDYARSGDRYDLIVDVAGSQSWRKNRRVLTPEGILVLAGAPTGNRLTGPIGRLARLWLASRLGSRKLVFFICKPNRADLAVVRELIEAGKVRPVVDRVYRLDEIADALATMGEGHVQGKLVVRIADGSAQS